MGRALIAGKVKWKKMRRLRMREGLLEMAGKVEIDALDGC